MSAKSVKVICEQDDDDGLLSFDDFVEVEIIKNNIYEDDNKKEIRKIQPQPTDTQ